MGGYGIDSFGMPSYDFSQMTSYDAAAPTMMGDLARMNLPNPYGQGFGDATGLSDMFVDTMTEEERAKRMAAQLGISVATAALPGPMSQIAANAIGVASSLLS